jgi:iron-sulfur cluster assembly accessory protein
MVQMTDIAAEKVRDFISGQQAEAHVGLRVGVRGGGCSGFQYALALDEQRDDDHVFETSGIRVLVHGRLHRELHGLRFRRLQPERHLLLRLWVVVQGRRGGALLRRLHRLELRLASSSVARVHSTRRFLFLAMLALDDGAGTG